MLFRGHGGNLAGQAWNGQTDACGQGLEDVVETLPRRRQSVDAQVAETARQLYPRQLGQIAGRR